MAVKYTVNLSESEIKQLQEITCKGKTAARKLKRAQILLLADEGHGDKMIAQMLKVGESTVHRMYERFGGCVFPLSQNDSGCSR